MWNRILSKKRYRIGACLIVVFALGPRARTDAYKPKNLLIPKELDSYLLDAERSAQLRPMTEKKIIWARPDKRKTDYALIYLHGFSASRREISPVNEKTARALRANLFFTRLTGHGQTGKELGSASLNDWKNDAREALEIGHQLGKNVIVVGTSMGATLAVWLALQKKPLDTLILLSPNFALKDKRSQLFLWPWGITFAKLFIGAHLSNTAHSDLEKEIWTLEYPLDAVMPMVLLLQEMKQTDVSQISTPTLFLFTHSDERVDLNQTKSVYEKWGTAHKKLVEVQSNHHVLAGDAMSPQTSERVVQEIIGFIQSRR